MRAIDSDSLLMTRCGPLPNRPVTLRLSDKFDRDLGTVSSLTDSDGGAIGRFSPGRDFAQVEALFARYEAHLSDGSGSAEEIYALLVELEPKVIDDEGEVISFVAAIVSRSPDGHRAVSLVNKRQ